MLSLGLKPGKCIILRGKRFSKEKFSHLHEIVALPNTLLVYPGPHAEDIETLNASGTNILPVMNVLTSESLMSPYDVG